ncbi:MAG: MBL fold metallo-hydrolase [Bacteroidota bacterium]
MITLKTLIFNAFQVNNYLLFDETNECVIIDAANSDANEDAKLFRYIEENHLKPVCLLSTHAHVDHILGNKSIIEKYNIPYKIHLAGKSFLYSAVEHGEMFGFKVKPSPMPTDYIEDNDIIKFGNSEIKALYTPGHAEGSLCFYSEQEGFLISGDVLFHGSIGRTDLPTGDFDTLIKSIKEKILSLPNDTIVYPGHGPETTVAYEKENNPFF